VKKTSLLSLFFYALPLFFVAAMCVWFPFRFRFQLDPDEGVNAIKAFLVLRGFRLYSDVWSDQPPAFTFMLAGLFRLMAPKVIVGRLLVLLLSAATLGSVMRYERQQWGGPHAMGAAAALVLLPYYPVLSVSIMTGLPSLALAVISFSCLAEWHHHPRIVWVAASAAALGLSVMTKAFTAILAPVFVLGLLGTRRHAWREGRWKEFLGPAWIWMAVFLAVVVPILMFVVRPENWVQLVMTHLQAARTTPYQEYAARFNINYHIRASIAVFLLALLGAGLSVRMRRWTALYLVAWIGLGYILLAINRPVWYHQQLLVTIPAAMLAGIAIGEGVRWIQALVARPRRLEAPAILCGAALLLTAGMLLDRVPATLEGFDWRLPNLTQDPTEDVEEYTALALVNNYASQTDWMLTDRPMVAFRARLPVPPFLAAITEKRIVTGELTDGRILDIMLEVRPEQVMLSRFSYPGMQGILTRDYGKVYITSGYSLYVRQDLLATFPGDASGVP